MIKLSFTCSFNLVIDSFKLKSIYVNNSLDDVVLRNFTTAVWNVWLKLEAREIRDVIEWHLFNFISEFTFGSEFTKWSLT